MLTKTVFLHKVRHILLNYAFLFFWSIFGEIYGEPFFSEIKVISQKRALKNSESFSSYHVCKGKNPEENFDLLKQLFLIKPVKADKY